MNARGAIYDTVAGAVYRAADVATDDERFTFGVDDNGFHWDRDEGLFRDLRVTLTAPTRDGVRRLAEQVREVLQGNDAVVALWSFDLVDESPTVSKNEDGVPQRTLKAYVNDKGWAGLVMDVRYRE